MKKEAILHIPLSHYAYSVSDEEVVFRIRTAKDDMKCVTLYYGDRCCRTTPTEFFPLVMEKVAFSSLFDYYSVTVKSPYKRIEYYFALCDNAGQALFYYGDQFEEETTEVRTEYYQFDYNQACDRAVVPDWVQDSIVYNIFPDSFATARRSISGRGETLVVDGREHMGKRGGTIIGIRENLDYIANLGFNTIYLNPIFSAGEYHKYDLIDYFHVDPVFGTDEDFRLLVQEAHARGLRVIIDGVFNHIGYKSDIFQDVVKYGKKSKYWDWFNYLKEPVVIPKSGDEIPGYECFAYEKKMPKLNQNNPDCANYFLSVGAYWVEKYDIDGWRLDVACEVCDDFWRHFRKTVKSIKPSCVLIGEVWETASHWLSGDMFDSTMNYDMRRYCERFFASRNINAQQFNDRVTEMLMRYRTPITYAQLNLLDSHDASRFLTLCGGRRDWYELAIAFLFTFPGATCVFYGDEKGCEGLLEDEFRLSMPWERQDDALSGLFKELAALRAREPALRRGTFKADAIVNEDVYSFVRELDGAEFAGRAGDGVAGDGSERIRVVLNRGANRIPRPEGKILLSRRVEGDVILPNGFVICK